MRGGIVELVHLCLTRCRLHQPRGAACPPRQERKTPTNIFSNITWGERGGSAVQIFARWWTQCTITAIFKGISWNVIIFPIWKPKWANDSSLYSNYLHYITNSFWICCSNVKDLRKIHWHHPLNQTHCSPAVGWMMTYALKCSALHHKGAQIL